MGKTETLRAALNGAGDALLASLLAPPCACCHGALDFPLAGPVCARCWEDIRALDGQYEGALRQAIHALKYEGRRSLARSLGLLLAGRAGATLADADCIVPVPLFAWRRVRRGFNQSAELAKALGPPVINAVWRIRSTATQTGLSASERHRNVAGAFRLSPILSHAKRERFITARVVVLIDDVMTTGATMTACAEVLRTAGAGEVRVLTLARAPLHSF